MKIRGGPSKWEDKNKLKVDNYTIPLKTVLDNKRDS
jgi:hypothetical protein